LVVALVEADPPEGRQEILLTRMQARSMVVNRGPAPAIPLWEHELRHLADLRLVDLREVSEITWGITPRPFADRTAQLIRELAGHPSPELAAVRRGERLDRRYSTLGRRTANLLVLVPIAVWAVVVAVAGPAASSVPGFPIAIILVIGGWAGILDWFGKSAGDIARGARDRVARRIAAAARRLIEGGPKSGSGPAA
jgi:hypothetical protein